MNTNQSIDLLKISLEIAKSDQANGAENDALIDRIVENFDRLKKTVGDDALIGDTSMSDIKTAVDITEEIAEI